MVAVFLFIARIWVMKTFASANVSLKAFLVDLESLRSSQRVIEAGCWLIETIHQNGKELKVPHHFSEEL